MLFIVYHYAFSKIYIYPYRVIEYHNQCQILKSTKVHSPREGHNLWWTHRTVLQQDLEIIHGHPVLAFSLFPVWRFFPLGPLWKMLALVLENLIWSILSRSKWIAGPPLIYTDSSSPSSSVCGLEGHLFSVGDAYERSSILFIKGRDQKCWLKELIVRGQIM